MEPALKLSLSVLKTDCEGGYMVVYQAHTCCFFSRYQRWDGVHIVCNIIGLMTICPVCTKKWILMTNQLIDLER